LILSRISQDKKIHIGGGMTGEGMRGDVMRKGGGTGEFWKGRG
jgi:hypothetical protein